MFCASHLGHIEDDENKVDDKNTMMMVRKGVKERATAEHAKEAEIMLRMIPSTTISPTMTLPLLTSH